MGGSEEAGDNSAEEGDPESVGDEIHEDEDDSGEDDEEAGALISAEDRAIQQMRFTGWDPNFDDVSPPLPGSITVAKKMAIGKFLPEEGALARREREADELWKDAQHEFDNDQMFYHDGHGVRGSWNAGRRKGQDLWDNKRISDETWDYFYKSRYGDKDDIRGDLWVMKNMPGYDAEEERILKAGLNTGWFAMSKATTKEKEAIASASSKLAQTKARERMQRDRKRPLMGEDIGTGEASPSAYVEIGPRDDVWTNDVGVEAVNAVVARHLSIPPEQASRLISLGSVWVWEEEAPGGPQWDRIRRAEEVEAHKILRVFPNPERFKTCYLHDWRDRIKKMDQDFVVVDKPPLMPCFAKVSNGREHVGQCLREALRVRQWGAVDNPITEDLIPCHELDDEVSGLVVLSRYKEAEHEFCRWHDDREVTFEFVALVTGSLEKGTYRHFFKKADVQRGQDPAPLHDEILLGRFESYADWDAATMEVVATAELAGGHSALRIRTRECDHRQRIRSQLAMLGCPCLNDASAVGGAQAPQKAPPDTPVLRSGRDSGAASGTSGSSSSSTAASTGASGEGTTTPSVAKGSEKVSEDTDLVKATLGELGLKKASKLAAQKLGPLGGAVSDEVLRGPYGHMLQLVAPARKAAARGVSQKPRKKVPVALHLARIAFKGRVITCAPPAYWPEGAAAAVAVKLTEQDVTTNIRAFLVSHGGQTRISSVGGKFRVRKEWLVENFIVEDNRVFVSAAAKDEWDQKRRVAGGDKVFNQPRIGKEVEKQAFKKKTLRNMRIRDIYVPPKDWGMPTGKLPRFKDIKKARVKPAPGYEGAGQGLPTFQGGRGKR